MKSVMITELETTLDIDIIKSELQEVMNYDGFIDQINLQTVKGKDPYYGSRAGNAFEEDETEFVHFYFETHYINSILQTHNLCRSRLMNLKSKTCLSYHKDPTPRFHIPITTNESCFFIIDKKVHHLPVGKCYIIDSTLPHTAVNASFEDRLHIIGTI
jgi:hypothetical protein